MRAAVEGCGKQERSGAWCERPREKHIYIYIGPAPGECWRLVRQDEDPGFESISWAHMAQPFGVPSHPRKGRSPRTFHVLSAHVKGKRPRRRTDASPWRTWRTGPWTPRSPDGMSEGWKGQRSMTHIDTDLQVWTEIFWEDHFQICPT